MAGASLGAVAADRPAVRAGHRRGARREATAGAVRREPGRGRLRGAGASARADGPGRLPAAPARPERRGRRLSGHLPRAGPPGRLDPSTGACWGTGSTASPTGSRPGPASTPPDGAGQSEADGRPPNRPADHDRSRPGPAAARGARAGCPKRIAAPVVLCDLEGRTHDEAARLLGWPIGTSRAGRPGAARPLRRRLARRGVSLPAAGFLAILSARRGGLGGLPALLESTIKAAAPFAVGGSVVAGAVPASAVGLAEGAIRTMFMTNLKAVAVLAVAGGILATGAGVYAYQGQGGEEQAPPQASADVQPRSRAPALKVAWIEGRRKARQPSPRSPVSRPYNPARRPQQRTLPIARPFIPRISRP